jgi:hypothetical protein
MKNNLLIIGAVALGIYLMTRKKEKKVYTKELLMAMSDADLQALLIDLGKQASQDKYLDPAAYSYLVVTEIERRKKTAVVTPTPAVAIVPIKTNVVTTPSYGPSTGIVAPMSF